MADRYLRMLGLLSAVVLPTGVLAQAANDDCARLKEPIPAASIGLPSNGATIESAAAVVAAPMAPAKLPFGPPPPEASIDPAVPDFCKVLGSIAPVDPQAPKDQPTG